MLPEDEDDLMKFFVKHVPACAEALSFFMDAKKVFSKLKWDSGFGGKPWAKIADKFPINIPPGWVIMPYHEWAGVK